MDYAEKLKVIIAGIIFLGAITGILVYKWNRLNKAYDRFIIKNGEYKCKDCGNRYGVLFCYHTVTNFAYPSSLENKDNRCDCYKDVERIAKNKF